MATSNSAADISDNGFPADRSIDRTAEPDEPPADGAVLLDELAGGEGAEELPTLGVEAELPTPGGEAELPTPGVEAELPTLGVGAEELPTLGVGAEELPTLGVEAELPTLGGEALSNSSSNRCVEEFSTLTSACNERAINVCKGRLFMTMAFALAFICVDKFFAPEEINDSIFFAAVFAPLVTVSTTRATFGFVLYTYHAAFIIVCVPRIAVYNSDFCTDRDRFMITHVFRNEDSLTDAPHWYPRSPH